MSKKIDYLSLMEELNHDYYDVNAFIDRLGEGKTQSRLINEAKEYWADKLGLSPKDVFYGDFRNKDFSKEENKIPKPCIIGFVTLEKYLNAEDLQAVVGFLLSSKVYNFPNLVYANNINIYGSQQQKQVTNLPKLKETDISIIEGCDIQSLGLECVKNYASFKYCKLGQFNIKEAKTLSLIDSEIEDISSLKQVEALSVTNTDIKNVNKDLVITESLYCENANGFELKLDESKKQCKWIIDPEQK